MGKNPIDKFAFHHAMEALLGELGAIGDVDIKLHHDVEGLQNACQTIGGRRTGEHFHKTLDTLPPNRFFWISATLKGRVVGTVAARCDESSWSLQEFVRHYWERTYEAEPGSCVRIAEGSPQAAAVYPGGRFAYLGEALIEEGLRDKKLSLILVRLALLFAFDEWRPSVAYGWMRDHHAYRGLGVRWGFNRCDTQAFDWIVPPTEKDWHNLAFLACDWRGFENLLSNPAPAALFHVRKSS